MNESILRPERVKEILRDCLFRDDEVKDGKPIGPHIAVRGIVANIGFHPDRLEGHRQDVQALLAELPASFASQTGDSFLQACNDRHGVQWTGLHRDMDELFILGLGLNLVESPIPRELWPAFGGVPIYRVLPPTTPGVPTSPSP